jgi:coenzyme Q-binding protein COQ10
MREMANHWVFHPGDNGGTDVEFLVELDFHSRLLDTMMGGFFDHAVTRMIDSFRARADVLYGDGEEG